MPLSYWPFCRRNHWPKPTAGLGFAELWFVLRPGLPVSVHLWDEATAPSPPREPGWSCPTRFASFWCSCQSFSTRFCYCHCEKLFSFTEQCKRHVFLFSFLLFHIRQRQPLTTNLPEVSQKFINENLQAPMRLLGMIVMIVCSVLLLPGWLIWVNPFELHFPSLWSKAIKDPPPELPSLCRGPGRPWKWSGNTI